jgi:hypothetical protein
MAPQHGRRGCWQPRGRMRKFAFQDPGHPAHYHQIWNVLDAAIRNGLASPTEAGWMKLQLDRRWRDGVVDALDRLAAKHRRCIKRVRGAKAAAVWMMPCSWMWPARFQRDRDGLAASLVRGRPAKGAAPRSGLRCSGCLG